MPVDLFGHPADYDGIFAVCDRHGMTVVADAAQSFGATWRGRRTGGLAPVTCTSFFPAKPLGCYGDGGAVFAEDDETAAVLRSLRVHGQGTHKYENVRIGMNGRLDTLQAAVLLAKLDIFDDELQMRDQVARRYHEALKDVVTTPVVSREATSAWAQYTVVVEDRDRVAGRLRDEGVSTAVYYARPLHQQAAYSSFASVGGALPVTERLAGQVLSLPMHPYLDGTTQERVVSAVRAAVGSGEG